MISATERNDPVVVRNFTCNEQVDVSSYCSSIMVSSQARLLPVHFLMMGESYLNSHYKFGGFRWHEFDPTYPLLKLLNKLHIVKLRMGRDEAYM